MRGTVLGLYTSTLLVQALTFVLRPTSAYRAIELGVSAQWLGLLAASFALLPLVLAVVVGRLSDRVGEKLVMVGGALLVLLAALVLAVGAGRLLGLLVANALLGLGHLASSVAQQAYVANTADPRRYDAAFGVYTFASSAGQAVGPAMLAVLGGSGAIPDTSRVFWAAVAAACVLVVCTSCLPGGRTARADGPDDSGSIGTLVRRRGFFAALGVSCVLLAAIDITLVYLPVLGAERGIAAATIGGLLTVRAVASMASRLCLGPLSRLLGRSRLLLGSLVVSAIGMALVPVPMPLGMLAAVVAVMGLGLGVGQPMTMSWLAEVTPAGQRGRAMSLRLTGNRLGQVVVPSVAGLVAAGAGAVGVFGATAAALLGVGFAARRMGPR
ncbi:MFS transporter [Marmoricola sp. Leaf446]|uniref:MFS transporter n=1 Tax=Marmoricola sp. Leaf446 TaxID=1736379 RepID=UPI0006FE2438|nr:MFS transporter [Marmoricola sp. Leaf446]KQT93480.1 MFS transporter [Marmoricola sp. Leaf446]